MQYTKRNVQDRFEAFYIPEPNSGCYLWLGGYSSRGYGQFWIDGKTVGAHAASYYIHKGDLNGLFVLHKCDNPSCVNPEHLFLGTHQDNMDDMKSKGRATGPKGLAHFST